MYHGSMQSGGQGVYLANVTRELSRLGHEVHVISAPPYPELDPSVHTSPDRDAQLPDDAPRPAPVLPRRAGAESSASAELLRVRSTRFTWRPDRRLQHARAGAAGARSKRSTGRSTSCTTTRRWGTALLMMRAMLGPRRRRERAPPARCRCAERRALRVDTLPDEGAAHRLVSMADAARRRAPSRCADLRLARFGRADHAALVAAGRPHARDLRRRRYRALSPGRCDEIEPGALLFVGNSEDYNKGIIYLLRAMALLPRSHARISIVVGGPSGAAPRVAPRDRAARYRRSRDDRRPRRRTPSWRHGTGARRCSFRRRSTKASGCPAARRWPRHAGHRDGRRRAAGAWSPKARRASSCRRPIQMRSPTRSRGCWPIPCAAGRWARPGGPASSSASPGTGTRVPSRRCTSLYCRGEGASGTVGESNDLRLRPGAGLSAVAPCTMRRMPDDTRPLRICFLMYHGSMESGGQGIYLANVTRELARLGHDVHVISGPPYPVLDPAVQDHRIETHSFQTMMLDRGVLPSASIRSCSSSR